MTKIQNQRISFSAEELSMFRHIIELKIKEAKESIGQMKESLESTYDQHMGSSVCGIDDYKEFSEKEDLLMLIARQERHVHNLEKALGRIANKTYGICRATGKMIDKRRLFLVPHATMCVEAKVGKVAGNPFFQ